MAEKVFIFSCIQPIYYISKILGLFPVKFNGKEFKSNKNIIFYSFIFISDTHIINFIRFISKNKNLFTKTLEVQSFINVIGQTISQICLIQNYIFCFYAINSLPKILNLLLKTSRILNICNFRFIKWKILVITSVLKITAVSILYYNHQFKTTSDGIKQVIQDRLYFIGNICKYLSTIALEIQFCAFCSLVRHLFHSINVELKSYTETGRVRVTNKRMKELQHCYNNLIQVTVYINSLYGMCNLLNMVMLNVFIQTDVYELVLYMYDKITHKQPHEFHVLFVILR
jgi:hypothetical protein